MAMARPLVPTASPGSPSWWYFRYARWVAVLATLTLLAATHYPKLVIGGPGDGPDKLLHLASFLTLTVLFRVSGIASSIPRAIGAMSLLAIFDEVTQEIPGLNRTFDRVDLLADGLGIILAAAWLKALGPPSPGAASFPRYQRRMSGLRLLLSRFSNWCQVLVAGTFGAMIGGTVIAVIGRNPFVGPVTMLVVGAIVGGIAAMVAAIESGRRQMDRRLDSDRRCLDCLERVGDGAPECGCGGRVAVEHQLASPPRGRILLPTIILVLGVAALGILLDLLHVFTAFQVGGPGNRVVKWFGNLPTSDAMAFDAALLGLIAAGSVAGLRWWSDRRASHAPWRCVVCGYDLRHRGADSICPECGARTPSAIADGGPSGDDRES